MTKVLLISNRVMHYRVPVYNYFEQRFREHGATFIVRSSSMQKQNPHPPQFDFKAIPFSFDAYRSEIERLQPDVVILFVHLKELMVWPLVHWLKYQGIPVALWSKAKNYDNPHNLISRCLYRYMHALCDGLILYSDQELKHVAKRHRRKAFPANNTVNFEHYPQIDDTPEDIKREFKIPYKRVVLSVGRMDVGGQRKKIDHLIEVFRNIKDDGIGLVIVGAGMSGEQLSKINPNNTMYLGEVYDPQEVQISKLFKMADVFSIPGHAGLGLNQAFFWGCPSLPKTGDIHRKSITSLTAGTDSWFPATISMR